MRRLEDIEEITISITNITTMYDEDHSAQTNCPSTEIGFGGS